MHSGRTRIKVCGITRTEDAIEAAGLGVDAIGFVFYPPSPRYVTPAEAWEIARHVPAFVTLVGLFLDPPRDWVDDVLSQVPLDMIQFHGMEEATFCESFGRPYIRAFSVDEARQISEWGETHRHARGILLDSHAPGAAGGTGERFAWDEIPDDLGRPLILAGGLTADNVADAVRAVRPWAVDVSSGVEQARGVKDKDKLRDFVRGVNSVSFD